MYHLSIHVLVVSVHNASGVSSEICRSYVDGGGKGSKTSRSRSKSAGPSANPTLGFDQFEQEYQERRGQVFSLSNVRPVYLQTSLKRAEDLLFQVRPVALHCNKYQHHHAVQVVLRNCSVISYVFDNRSGDVTRVYLDHTAQQHTQDVCSTAIVTTDKLVLGMDTPRIVAFVNPNRDKAKRAYVSTKGVCRTANSSESRAAILSFNSNHQLLCATHAHRICIFQWKLPEDNAAQGFGGTRSTPKKQVKISARAASYQDSTGGDALLDTQFGLCGDLLLDKCRIVYCQFDKHVPDQLLVVYEEDRGRVKVCRAKFDAGSKSIHLLKHASQCLTLTGDGNTKLHVTAVGCAPAQNKLVIGCTDGTLILVRTSNRSIREQLRIRVRQKYKPLLVIWHPQGAMFVVFFTHGDMCAFDTGLQRLNMIWEKGEMTDAFPLTHYLTFTSQVTHAVWGPPFDAEVRPTHFDSNSLAIMFDRGPLVVVKFNLGLRLGSSLSCKDLLSQRLRNCEVTQATQLIKYFDDVPQQFACFSIFINYLFRSPKKNGDNSALLEKMLLLFWPRFSSFAVGNHPHFEYYQKFLVLYTRFFHQMLRLFKFECAFYAAKQINKIDLYYDLYIWAVENNRASLAEVVAPLCTATLIEHKQLQDSTLEDFLSYAASALSWTCDTTTTATAISPESDAGTELKTGTKTTTDTPSLPTPLSNSASSLPFAYNDDALESAIKGNDVVVLRKIGVSLEAQGRLAEAIGVYGHSVRLQDYKERAEALLSSFSRLDI